MEIVKESKLTEAKEKLPVSFLTDFVSRGWDDIGYLKETIKSISESFSGTKKVEGVLQDLLDAYLVCIGQLELHLQQKDYLDVDLGELKEGLEITVSDEGNVQVKADPDTVVSVDQNEKVCTEPECSVPPVETNIEPIAEPAEEVINDEPFEKPFDFDAPEAEGVRKFEKPEVADFFVDFDDPVGEPVTEKELYGEGEEPIEGEKIDADIEKENFDEALDDSFMVKHFDGPRRERKAEEFANLIKAKGGIATIEDSDYMDTLDVKYKLKEAKETINEDNSEFDVKKFDIMNSGVPAAKNAALNKANAEDFATQVRADGGTAYISTNGSAYEVTYKLK